MLNYFLIVPSIQDREVEQAPEIQERRFRTRMRRPGEKIPVKQKRKNHTKKIANKPINLIS